MTFHLTSWIFYALDRWLTGLIATWMNILLQEFARLTLVCLHACRWPTPVTSNGKVAKRSIGGMGASPFNIRLLWTTQHCCGRVKWNRISSRLLNWLPWLWPIEISSAQSMFKLLTEASHNNRERRNKAKCETTWAITQLIWIEQRMRCNYPFTRPPPHNEMTMIIISSSHNRLSGKIPWQITVNVKARDRNQ